MAFPTGWAGYDELTLTNPPSALTDFTYIISLDQLSTTWHAQVQAAGGDIRATDGSNNQLPADLIEYDSVTNSGLLAIKFSPANSGTQKLRIWAGSLSVETYPADNATYGAHAAYSPHVKAFYPYGGGDDRTSNNNDLASTGSPTVGGAAALIPGGKATTLNGSSQYFTATSSVPTATPLTALAMVKPANDTLPMNLLGVYDTDSGGASLNLFTLALRGDLTGDPVYAQTVAAGTPGAGPQPDFAPNDWSHVAAAWPAVTNSRRAFLKGLVGTPDVNNLTPTGIDSIVLGARVNTGGAPSWYFVGDVAFATLYDIDVKGRKGDGSIFGKWTCPLFSPPEDTGIRYYRPKPYLIVKPAGLATASGSEDKPAATVAPSDEFVEISLDYLPDFSEEYSLKVRTGFGAANVGIDLEDGWNLTKITQDLDSNFDENVTAIADLVKAAGGFIPTAKGGAVSDAERTQRWVVKATNVPIGYYESVIGKDSCGAKRLQGWRYVGFAPFNSCPTDICGVTTAGCQDDNAAIYGLVFENGAMVFRRLDQVRFIDKVERDLADTGTIDITPRQSTMQQLKDIARIARNDARLTLKKECIVVAGVDNGLVRIDVQVEQLGEEDAANATAAILQDEEIKNLVATLNGGTYDSPHISVSNLEVVALPAP